MRDQNNHLAFLQLLQLADSTLPIGSAAHSFGLETLVAEEYLNVERLERFLHDYLHEAGLLESVFCRRSYRLVVSTSLATFADPVAQTSHTGELLLPSDQESLVTAWLALNEQLSAFKTARESRVASAMLGRRFLQLAQDLDIHPLLTAVWHSARNAGSEIHYSTSFGLVGSLLALDETLTVLAYLQQSLSGLVSACQRLLPLGQSRASRLLWQLKPDLLSIALRSEEAVANDALTCFTPLVDTGSMRHPTLTTRLFIS
ncbi:MAG: hypothetical protein IMW89_16535 [Ktedonobacteraceae bacterium]|nr:hypothetical protein [Ktedonobacteraceae bacterium]